MEKIEKSIFISYRHEHSSRALAIFQKLNQEYDVFIDYDGINSGDFGQIIINQIKSRAHFLIILTPNTLARCSEPNDWLRREIEIAIEYKRNIVSLMFDNFDWKEQKEYLTGKLALLEKYNGLPVPPSPMYFDYAIDILCNRYLNIDVNSVIHPISESDKEIEKIQIAELVKKPAVTEQQLQANNYFERGNRHWELENFLFAIEDYTEAIKLNPEYTEAYNNRGVVYRKVGKLDKAISDFNQAIQLNEIDYIYDNRGLAYGDTGNYELAISDFEKAIHLNPDSASSYNNRGLVYLKEGDVDKAITDLNRAIKLNPSFIEAYISLSLAYLNKKDYESAIANLKKALKIDSNYYGAYINLGIVYAEMGDLDEAIAQYNEAIKINSQVANFYYNRGLAHRGKGDLENAIVDYSKAIKLKPHYISAYNNRGWAYYQKGDYDLAIADYEQVLWIDPEDELAKNNLALALSEKNEK